MAGFGGWAKKFSDTLSGTLDSVKTYGSNVQSSNLPIPGFQGKQPNGTTPSGGQPNNEAKTPTGNRSFFGLPNKNLLTEGSPIKTLIDGSPIKSPGSLSDLEKSPAKEPLIESNGGAGRERTLSNASSLRSGTGSNAHADKDFQKFEVELDLFNLEEYGVSMQSYVAEKKMEGNQQLGANKVDMDATSTTMEQEEKPEKKINPTLLKIKRFLQDNRMEDDDEALVHTGEGHELLKRVLNIMFLTVGGALFVAVVVIVIYAVVDEMNNQI